MFVHLTRQKFPFNICPNIRLIGQKEESKIKCRASCKICNGSGIISGKTLEYVKLKQLTYCNADEMRRSKAVGCIHCGIMYRTKGINFAADENFSLKCIWCNNPTLITSANPIDFKLDLVKIRELKKYWYGC